MGIRTKILLCLIAVLVPISAASMFTVSVIDARLNDRIESELGNSLRLESARIGEVLEGYRQDAIGLAAGSHVRDFVGGIDAHRRGALPADVALGGVDGFSYIDPDADWPLQQLALALKRKAGVIGTEVVELRLVDRRGATLGESIGFGWSPLDETLPARAMEEAQPLFGDAFRNAEGRRRLGLVAPVYDAAGTTVGALMLETRLGPAIDLVVQHEGLGESSEAHIAQPLPNGDAQFITLLRFDRDAAFERVVPAESELPIVQALDAPGGRVLRAKDYRRVDSILALETIPASGWGLVVKIDEAEAIAPLVEGKRAIQLAALATVLCIFAGWLFCLHPIARRLQRLATAAQRITDGNLSSRIGDVSLDEIGEVARSIDRLAAELKADRLMRGTVEERLRHQALHDELTGLHNRKRANAVIAELSEDNGDERTSAIAFLDLDGFKGVNDLYGHAAGDAVLVAIAGRLRHAIDREATLARWGGDEFVVILPDGDERAIEAVGSRIRRLFDEPVVTEFGTHQLGCSVGLATSGPNCSLSDAVTDADARMYEQKKQHHQAHSVDTVAARNVERALRDDRIEVWYQPIVAVRSRDDVRLRSAESLVRMRTRNGDIVGPNEFLAEVRKRDLGRELDRRVMTRSLEALARWRRAGVVDEAFRLSINLTDESLRASRFVDDVAEQLKRLEIPPSRLTVELSEEAGDIDVAVLARLRALGVGLALDDVGLHRSNLDRLVGLAPDVAKIDRQWVDDDVVLPRLIDICRQLGMQIVAEGVETEAQLTRLHDLGVTCFQGFLFSRPLPAAPFIESWGRAVTAAEGESAAARLSLVG